MKLKNKLLPLIGASALLATVAPIALTSCVTTSDSGEWINLLNPYSPTISKLATTGMSNAAAKTAYFGSDETEWLDEEEVAERLMQDYLWSYSHGFTVGNRSWARTSYNYYNLKFNYLRFGQATTYKGTGHSNPLTVPTISFEVEYEYDVTYDYYWDDIKYNYVDKGVMAFTNLPITISFQTVYPKDSDSFTGLSILVDYDTLSHTECLTTPYYHGKIPFSYVNEYTETETKIKEITTESSQGNYQRLCYSGCFSDESDLEDFAERCPAFYSYYMMSVFQEK